MKAEYKTKARALILDYMKKNPENRFTAREIYDSIKGELETVNRTTVYRNLDRMCEQGIMVRYTEPNRDSWYYQYSEEHSHCNDHMHAQCSECGRIFHLENEFAEEFEQKLQNVYGLTISPSSSLLVGKCDDCNKIKKKK